MGSPSGDVDDAYAIAALVRGAAPVAIAAVAGNTSAVLAHENNQRLCQLLGYRGPLLRAGHEAVDFLRTFRGRVTALGPLTNVARAMPVASEIIVVGGNATSRGRWPPLWPHEFNLTSDVPATSGVFHSDLPLTIFPLDVARQLYVTRADLDALAGPLGEFLRANTVRWWRHLRLVRMTGRFPIYDLAAALYALDGRGFVMEDTVARMRPNTHLEFGRGVRKVRVCRALDREALWRRAVQLLNGRFGASTLHT